MTSNGHVDALDTVYHLLSIPLFWLLKTMFCPHLFVVLALFLATFVAAADLYKILDSASRLPFALEKKSATHVCHCSSQVGFRKRY